jgi:hypothetical protein
MPRPVASSAAAARGTIRNRGKEDMPDSFEVEGTRAGNGVAWQKIFGRW